MSLKRRISVESSGVGEVGRLVDSGQADDRRMIRLVRDRRLLYARNNMPVASYYAQVKALWQEVADEMGWTVADVRRKWSHVRNSYSRHLRNEMHGARTGKGRVVSKWYLADELEFLREHMATDMRSTPFQSFAPTFLEMDMNEDSSSEHNMDVKPFITPSWFTMPSPAPASAPVVQHDIKYEPQLSIEDSSSSHAFTAEENSSYFQFFRGIYSDYQELSAKKQRLFKRQCLGLLHELLDQEEGIGGTSNVGNEGRQHQQAAINLSHSRDTDDEPDSEGPNAGSILPHDEPPTAQFKFLKRE